MRGGKREGAGRKSLYPTTTMRVPIALKARFEALIAEYKAELSANPGNVTLFDSVTEIKDNPQPQQIQDFADDSVLDFDSVTESNEIDQIALFRKHSNRKQRKILIKQFGSEAAAARYLIDNAMLMTKISA